MLVSNRIVDERITQLCLVSIFNRPNKTYLGSIKIMRPVWLSSEVAKLCRSVNGYNTGEYVWEFPYPLKRRLNSCDCRM